MKKRIQREISILLIFVNLFLLGGCFNYRDINKLIFAIAVILDYDEDTETVSIYVEAFRSYRGAEAGGEKGQRILFKGKGKTLFEAIRDINLSTSYKVNYTQCKAIIFTKKAAEQGIKRFTDMIDRDQEFLLRPYVFVLMDDPEQVLKMKLKEEEYIGWYLFNLIQNVGTASRNISVTNNEFLVWRLQGSRTYILTVLRVKKEQPEEKLETDGAAVMKDDKMIEVLKRADMQGLNFLMDRVKSGTLEVTNPFHEDKFVTLEILNSDTKTKVEYEKEKGKVKLTKQINVKVTFGEAQGSFIITDESVQKLEENAEENIKRYSSKLFNDYKYKGVDVFEVQEELFRRYGNVPIVDPIKETTLEIKVNVKVEGSSDKLNAM